MRSVTYAVTHHNTVVRIRHKALRTFYETDDPRGLLPELVSRIRRILTGLQRAVRPGELDFPGYRLHQLSGDRVGFWSMCVNSNWRIIFRFENGEATHVDLVDYH